MIQLTWRRLLPFADQTVGVGVAAGVGVLVGASYPTTRRTSETLPSTPVPPVWNPNEVSDTVDVKDDTSFTQLISPSVAADLQRNLGIP